MECVVSVVLSAGNFVALDKCYIISVNSVFIPGQNNAYLALFLHFAMPR